ncbi:translation initiation factor IF-2 [Planctomycetales bacterium]|nr:translation initiation factor IF-2 [Planctomycetales bacterium]
MSIRIHALAKKLDTSSADILAFLKEIGIEAKNSLSGLSEEEEKLTVEAWKKKKEKPARSAQQVDTPQLRTGRKTGEKVPVLPSKKQAEQSVKDGSSPQENPEIQVNETQPETTAESDTAVETPPDVSEVKPEPVQDTAVSATASKTVSETESSIAAEVEQNESAAEQTAEEQSAGTADDSKKIPTLAAPIGFVDLSTVDSRTDLRRGRGKDRKKNKDNKKDKEPQEEKKEKTKPESGSAKKPHQDRRNESGRGDTKRQQQTPKTPVAMGFTEAGYAAATRGKDYVAPMRRILDKNKEGGGTESGKSGRTMGTGVHLAAVPQARVPVTPAAKEPAAMKPVMKLTKEIREAAAAGNTDKVESLIREAADEQRSREDKLKGIGGDKKLKKGRGQKGIPDVIPAAVDDNLPKKAKKGFKEAEFPVEERRKRKSSHRSRNKDDYDEEGVLLPNKLHRLKIRGRAVNTAAARKTDVILQLPCTVKQFSESTGVAVAVLIKKLLGLEAGLMTINSALDKDTVELLAAELNVHVEIRDHITLEDELAEDIFEQEDPAETLKQRPPVVTVLGHVDHGKTTLLDKILHLDVVSGEKGGITQHIRAYRVKMENGSDITFVDTPGHEAFTEMRARGANCTDIVILVIAADDGIMPQTEEAISHAKAAGVPIIVAVTKIDLPGINDDKIQRIFQDLAARELTPSEWGGDVEIIRCSGITGQGIDELLSMIQLIAELHNLRANPDRPAVGVALEASLQAGKGVVCKVLVQKGTLRPGDIVLCGTAYGRVRLMQDSMNPRILVKEAAPSTPVNLIGLDVVPDAGSSFCVVDDISKARTIAEQRHYSVRSSELDGSRSHVTLETLYQRISDAQTIQTLNIIVRADVRGSIEAIKKELGKLEHPEVRIRILQATVGGITEADVQLADASDAVIVGFNVVPDEKARLLADKKKIQIRRYDIIYDLANDIRAALEGMLKPLEQVKELGRAAVQRVFSISRLGSIAGCRVISGTIERDCKVRVIRESRIIGEYPLESLKREKDDVREVRDGYECGIKLRGFNDLKEGDILETYKIEEISRTF